MGYPGYDIVRVVGMFVDVEYSVIGFMNGLYVPVSMLNVTSRKLITFEHIVVVIFRPMS